MANRTSGGSVVTDADNTWGNNATSDAVSAAADAQYGTAVTWDYYRTCTAARASANTATGPTTACTTAAATTMPMVRLCFCMTYGDGDGTTFRPLVSLDVAGHEMTHGVTSRTARLIYSGESGGLNEATSDIFGTMVEFYANNANYAGDY